MKAKILDFRGSWSSGIATLIVEHEDGSRHDVYCDNGQTARALEAAFGNVITRGHCLDVEAIKGKTIDYYMDDMGLVMAGFNIPEDSE